MERTKGKIRTAEQGCLVSESGAMIADIGFVNVHPIGNAEHLVKCWNAFEEGGSLSTIYKLIDEAAGDICEAQMNKTKFDSLSLARQKLDRARKIIKLAQAEAEK